jgi:hypothetical protein
MHPVHILELSGLGDHICTLNTLYSYRTSVVRSCMHPEYFAESYLGWRKVYGKHPEYLLKLPGLGESICCLSTFLKLPVLRRNMFDTFLRTICMHVLPVLREGALNPVLEAVILQHLVPGVAHSPLHPLLLLLLLPLLLLFLFLLLLSFLFNFCNSPQRL